MFSNKKCSCWRSVHWQINKTCHIKIARVVNIQSWQFSILFRLIIWRSRDLLLLLLLLLLCCCCLCWISSKSHSEKLTFFIFSCQCRTFRIRMILLGNFINKWLVFSILLFSFNIAKFALFGVNIYICLCMRIVEQVKTLACSCMGFHWSFHEFSQTFASIFTSFKSIFLFVCLFQLYIMLWVFFFVFCFLFFHFCLSEFLIIRSIQICYDSVGKSRFDHNYINKERLFNKQNWCLKSII